MIPIHTLVAAYTIGRFPMGIENNEHHYHWVEPLKRAIIPLSEFYTPRRLRRRVKRGDFSASLNADFNTVIHHCGRRDATWINSTIINSYEHLHHNGLAHSIEIYVCGQLAGGLYGVAIGGAFFGESMFSNVSMASQVALIHLVDHLRRTDFQLLDIQMNSPHLKRFGAIDIPGVEFQQLLRKSLFQNCRIYSQPFDGESVAALQRINQIS